ncbi:winged helix-turn-helix transcriptional regulator [Fodinibius roseus]
MRSRAPRVKYQLTDFGEELCEILQSLCDWTKALEESVGG